MKRIIFFITAFICTLQFSACVKAEEQKQIIPETEQSLTEPPSSEIQEQESSAGTEYEGTEPDAFSEVQTQWRVNICSDMPQPYLEVLNQYEQFMNADNRNLNDESVQEKIWGGEWKYLYDELGASLISWESSTEDIFYYALKDLTGDGFPELIIAYKDIPYIIYTYSEEGGIGMEYASSYYTMTIYDNNIVEYVSAGMYSSTTYLQFQEDAGGWVIADTIAVSGTWDFATQSIIDKEFYGGNWDGSGKLDKAISEEEYLQIQKKYVTKPMDFEWIPFVSHNGNAWYSYEKTDDFTYEYDFMASRDGQGYHWWIYLEAAYIMRDYGKRKGYDFTSDYWTVQRIYPIDGGYYNIVLSQNNHDVTIDLLCHPHDGKYLILYAQYEGGNRIAGVNEIPYASQLEWRDFDFHETYETPSVNNPYGEICEASVSSALDIALFHYEQDTGYDGEWHVRELFGRSPFFDYLVETQNHLLWVCVDIGQHDYVYVAFE